LDKFPEAFRRFERVVDTDRIQTFDQLLLSFRYWAGHYWKGTRKQVEALKVEAMKKGIPVPTERGPEESSSRTWRNETVTVKGKTQYRFRDLKTGRFIKKPL